MHTRQTIVQEERGALGEKSSSPDRRRTKGHNGSGGWAAKGRYKKQGSGGSGERLERCRSDVLSKATPDRRPKILAKLIFLPMQRGNHCTGVR